MFENNRSATEADQSRWLSQQETAKYLGCSVRQVQLITRTGRLPVSYALGPRSPRYDCRAVDQFMDATGRAGEGAS